MPSTTYLKDKLAKHAMNLASYAAPSTIYAGLFSAMPGVDGGGVELTTTVAPGYARQPLSSGASNGGGLISWNVAVLFPSTTSGSPPAPTGASSPWPQIVAVGLFDALTGGNLLAFEPLTNPTRLGSGDYLSFAVNQVTFAIV